jgi:NTE family protein
MRFSTIFYAVVLFSLASGIASARPKIGLALSGGGARGMAHIGVLKALEDLRIPVDYIAGTSIGAFIGALYSSGYSAKEIEDLFSRTDWDDMIFRDRAARTELPLRRKIDHGRYLFDFEMGYQKGRFVLPSGLIHGQKFSLLLDSLFLRAASVENFSRLPIPYRAIATDAESGKMVVLDHGNLADAVRASSAYPGLFSPVEIEGRLLLDGGAVNNLPVDLVKKMGADIIIAVDISSPLQDREELLSFVDFTDQFVTILMRKTVQSQMDLANFVLVPKLNDGTTFSYGSLERIIKSGEDEVRAYQSKLNPYRLAFEAYENLKKIRRLNAYEPKRIDSIHIEGFQRVDKRTVESRLSLKPGDQFNLTELNADLTKIYSLGDFERADFSFKEEDQKNILSIRAIEKRWGPNYFHFGVSWDGEIKGKRDGNALLNFQLTRLNRLNAEWITDVQMGSVLKLDSEFYQPLDYFGLFFIAPKVSSLRMNRDFYASQKRVATHEIDAVAGEIDLGVDFKKYGELRLGLRRGFLNSESELAVSAIPTFDVQTGVFLAQAKFDRLDSVYFPSRGVYASTEFLSSRSYLGADHIYRKISGQAHGFYSVGRQTFFLSASAGGNLGSEIPLYDEFLLGGFRSLSGYREEELRGQHFGVGRVGYLYRLAVPATFFWSRVYLGAWGESGNIWNRKKDIDVENLKYAGTLALGLETKLGPIFLAYGQSGSDVRQFYISVGRTFGIRSPRVF